MGTSSTERLPKTKSSLQAYSTWFRGFPSLYQFRGSKLYQRLHLQWTLDPILESSLTQAKTVLKNEDSSVLILATTNF